MNLGNKIMTLRKKNNMSQEELAEKVGVTRQTISKWELEETSPDITQAKTLSNIFKVSLDELVSNDLNSIILIYLKMFLTGLILYSYLCIYLHYKYILT